MTVPNRIEIGNVTVANDAPFVLIAGPCALESRAHAMEMSAALVEITSKLGIGLIYKSSFDKANRTSLDSPRGMGLAESLPILADVRETHGCPVLTDIHLPEHCAPVAEAVDVLQIPAFLSRQTDLIVAAAETGRALNIKKGQFLAPWDMKNVVAKLHSTGNRRVLLTDRGASFGYNNLVADMRSIKLMQDLGCPVVFDATHSVQLPGGAGSSSAGQREFAPVLAKAAVAAGADAIFLEVHPRPDQALCDGPNSLPLDALPDLFGKLKAIREVR